MAYYECNCRTEECDCASKEISKLRDEVKQLRKLCLESHGVIQAVMMVQDVDCDTTNWLDQLYDAAHGKSEIRRNDEE
jgi:hypothetical protein